MEILDCKLGIQQRVLPFYRVPFFSTLAGHFPAGMQLFAGTPRRSEAIDTADQLGDVQLVKARNIHLLSGKLYLCLQPNLLGWLKSFEPGVLIIESNPRYLSTPNAIDWMKARKKPVIGWGLGAPIMTGPFSARRVHARREFLKKLDAVIAYSKQGAEEYAESGVPESRIFVAPNSSTHRPSGTMPIRPISDSGRAKVLFVGRLQMRKRLDLLFKACASLTDQLQPDVTVIGDGPDRGYFENAAREFYPSVKFTGAKKGKELEPFFTEADLFVLPGTGGLAVQEAMSYGLPVIVAEGDGTQSQLVRPGNGWMVRPGSLDDLITKLTVALSDLPKLRNMGLESYRIARDEVNIEKMVQVFLDAVHAVREQ